MKKTITLALILVCLMALGVVCIRPVKAQTQNDITINSDGSVTPSTAPIKQTGNTYTLTSNVGGAIYVDRNNTILDGNGYTSPDKSVNWTGYSLDGQPNVMITSNSPITNVTIANLTSGMHNITVYANDSYGNIAVSQTINFAVEKPQLFPTALVAAVSVAAVAVVCVGLILYLRKRKR
jgi:hypothetical protein